MAARILSRLHHLLDTVREHGEWGIDRYGFAHGTGAQAVTLAALVLAPALFAAAVAHHSAAVGALSGVFALIGITMACATRAVRIEHVALRKLVAAARSLLNKLTLQMRQGVGTATACVVQAFRVARARARASASVIACHIGVVHVCLLRARRTSAQDCTGC